MYTTPPHPISRHDWDSLPAEFKVEIDGQLFILTATPATGTILAAVQIDDTVADTDPPQPLDASVA